MLFLRIGVDRDRSTSARKTNDEVYKIKLYSDYTFERIYFERFFLLLITDTARVRSISI